MRMRRMMMAKTSAPPLAVSGTFGTPVDNGDPLTGSLTITGGTSPYSVSVYSGTAPPGVTFSVSGSSVVASGNTTTNGSYSWTLRVTSTDGQHADSAQSVTVAAGGDPYWANVVALLHFDGTDGSTTFTDETGKTWTANGAAQIDTAQSKFGGASGLFGGSPSYIAAGSSSDWALGSGSFTVELFVRFTSHASVMSLLSNYVSGGALGWSLQRRSDANTIRFGYGDNPLIDVSWTPTDGVWYHLAVCRDGTSIRVFVDGTQIGSTATNATNISDTSGLNIGRLAGLGIQYFNGHMDEVRITKGVARYTANFTPPTEPFPNS